MDKHNVFISFRYSDGHVYKEILAEIFDNSVVINDFSEDEDRSNMSEDSIRRFLYSKLKKCSVTIFIVTPQSLEHKISLKDGKLVYDDWIYDELRYSLEDRDNNRLNGLIAVYTPEVESFLITKSYHECQICGEKSEVNIINNVKNLFRQNMMNIKPEYKKSKCDNVYDSEKDSYCSLISWDEFKIHYKKYIQAAYDKRSRADQFNITKRMNVIEW